VFNSETAFHLRNRSEIVIVLELELGSVFRRAGETRYSALPTMVSSRTEHDNDDEDESD
jgi:hypothetical protein